MTLYLIFSKAYLVPEKSGIDKVALDCVTTLSIIYGDTAIMSLQALLAPVVPYLTPIANFCGNLIFARNTNKSTSTSKKIAQSQQQTQLKIAHLQIQSQAELEKHRQIHQLELEMDRQQFQERMALLGFSQQVTLEQARQEFQLRLKNLDYEHQQTIEKFRAEVNAAINQKNLNFQRWKFEQETILQQQLATYGRETQLIIAKEQRKTALALPEINQIVQNWPLRIFPSQIINAYKGSGPIPLRIIPSLPEVEYDKHGNATKFPKIEEEVASGLRKLLNPHYSFNDKMRPTQLLDGAWDSNRFHGGTSIMVLFGMLKSEPTLILDSKVVGNYLNLKVAYWGLGQEDENHYFYEEIISRFPFKKILHEAAKARALKWKTEVRDKLLARGKPQKEINEKYAGEKPPHVAIGINAINLALLEEQEELKRDGIETSPAYQINHEDWEVLYRVLITIHQLLAAWIADIHHLIHHNTPPKLPDLLPDLLDNELRLLPIPEIITAIVAGYKETFKALEFEQPHWIPELALQLAQGLAVLPDKSFGEEMIDYSLQLWLQLHGVASSHIDSLSKVASPHEIPFLTQLTKAYQLIGNKEAEMIINQLIQDLTLQAEKDVEPHITEAELIINHQLIQDLTLQAEKDVEPHITDWEKELDNMADRIRLRRRRKIK